ncbi:DNA-binding SARP family transcriptional activator [Herbihabitans rhizosphaerae]|uniref:DNA-binding SARP family transcriptional activator n=1 Tax=Herbihabitans rhizosphaerae TaxID=1872711 RepID=A0A4Q7L0U4_9PSEU|nr:BTAD domain-containing putative transcriptional regulator [Herbihabitans rhizosphaerae]RZS43098.1 DNA-binding SARP family transcriptional activator [Herbihabitans rhizosphaerae]
MSTDPEFRLLGPVEMLVNGVPRPIGRPKQRCVLASLLLAAGQPVSPDTLADHIWGRPAAQHSRSTLYAYLAGLRRDLGAAGVTLTRQSGGYRVDVSPSRVDVLNAAAIVTRARRLSGTPRATLLAQALDLWRGEPLADLSGDWVDRVRDSLRRQRLGVLTEWARLRLADAGTADDVIRRLRQPTADHPLAEALAAQYIGALGAAGRVEEAVDHYEAIVRRLDDELGAEPSELLTAARDTVVAAVRTRRSPAQLPPAPVDLIGRDAELAELDELTVRDALVVIAGQPGVGKTTLAVTWARRHAADFPDGQLYADLGAHSGGEPACALDVLSGFLRAFGVAREQIPRDEAAAAALYRSVLATRKVLIVLDDAAGAAQVRPLLPGAGGCATVVTSRRRLEHLMIDEGARRIRLRSLRERDAVGLLAAALDDDRARQRDDLAELAALCGGLPLALRIAAANLAGDPARAVDEYVRDLRARTALAGVRGAFELSYQRLEPGQRRLFRLLACHPGPDIRPDAAAALAEVTPSEAHRLLDGLASAHLLDVPTHPTYRLHELLRQFARDRAEADEDGLTRLAAACRLGKHYAATTARAVRLAAPSLAMPTIALAHKDFADEQTALAWLDAERPNLVALAASAQEQGQPELAWQLSGLLRGYFQVRAFDPDWRRVTEAGVAAARQHGDHAARATAELAHGYFLRLRGGDHEALRALETAAAEAERAGWRPGSAAALTQLGRLYPNLGRPEEGMACLIRAIDLAAKIGDPAIEGAAHGNLGWVCGNLGHLRRALAHLSEELRLLPAARSRFREANALSDAGLALAQLGDVAAAIDKHTAALALGEALGDRSLRADAHVNLASAYLELGDADEAERHARASLALATRLAGVATKAEALSALACVENLYGRTDAALARHRQAVRAGRECGVPRSQVEVLTRFAEHTADLSDVDTALAVAREHGYRVFEARALCAAARSHLAAGRLADADAAANESLSLCRDTGHRPGEQRALAVLATVSRNSTRQAGC